jgi:two-component system, sensor histidine kinase PdtaS
MKKCLFFLLLLVYTEGAAQSLSDRPLPVEDTSQTYQNLAFWFQKTPQYNQDSVLFYYDRAEEVLAKRQPVPYKAFAELYKNRAEYCNGFHFFKQTEEYATKAWAYWEKMTGKEQEDKLLAYKIQYCLAVTQMHEGQVKKGIDMFTKNYERCLNDPRPEVQARLLKDKGYFFGHQSINAQLSETIQYFQQSLSIYETLDSTQYADAKLRIYTNFARFYHKLGRDDLSDAYFQKIEDIRALARNPYVPAFHGMEKGEYLIQKKEYAKAEVLIKSSMAGLEQYSMINTNYYQRNLSLLGTIARKKGDYDKAIDYYNRSKTISVTINYKDWVIENLQNLAITYELKGEAQKALLYQKQYIEEKLKIEKERSEKSLKEYELQEAIVNSENKLRQQRIRFWAALAFLGLAIAAGTLLYRLTRQLRKRNEEKEFLIKEIHHRVKNNLQVLSSLLNLQSKYIKDENALDAVREGQNRVEAMGLIHQRLYTGANLSSVEMQDYLQNLGNVLLDSFGDDERIEIEYAVQSMHLDVDTAIPLGLIINELVTNSLKYAFPNEQSGIIQISLWLNEIGKLCLKVSDNGVGKNEMVLTEKPKAGMKKSTSFGSSLIVMLSKKLKGVPQILPQEKGYATLIEFEAFKMVV